MEYYNKEGRLTDFTREKTKPTNSVVLKEEMNGKYGWFEASMRYNLPTYYSGITFDSPRSLKTYEKYEQEKREIKWSNLEVESFSINREDIDAERRDIERKAKADGTWLKAPNGKDTNLSPKQWVDVRTKAFKAWFGDWELMQKEVVNVIIDNNITNRKEAIIALTSLKEEQRRKNPDGGEYFICEDTGDKIYVSNSDAKHSMSFRNADQIKLVGSIDKIIANAVFLREELPNADEPSATLRIKIYYVPINVNGTQYSARLTVKEYERGNFGLLVKISR